MIGEMQRDQPSRRRVVVDVDSRGLVSLARFGIKDTQLVVEEIADGGLIMHQAVVLTPAEARHSGNPEATAALDEALASAQAGEVRSYKLRSEQD
jgi:hypothetical protein